MNKKDLYKYIIAFTYGDGSLVKQAKDKTAHFQASQLEKNKDYILWRASILAELTTITYNYYTNSAGNPMIATYTKVHPVYTQIWQRFYYNGRKTIEPHLLKFMDFETLAILFQDDGNGRWRKGVNKTPEIRLATHNFNYAENFMLKKALKERLNLEWNIQKQTKNDSIYYYLSLRTKDYHTFYNGVIQYIQPSFMYKLMFV